MGFEEIAMNEPKRKWNPQEAEEFKKYWGNYPRGYVPQSPEEQLKQAKAQNVLNLTLNPTHQDSVMYDRLHPGEKSIFPQPKSEEDILKEKTTKINYQKSLLELQKKEKEATEEKTDDLTKERSRLFGEISKTQDIVDKTKKVSQIDEKGDYVEEVEKPTFSYKQRQQAKAATESYTKRLQMIDLTEKLRNQGIQLNISDTEKYFKAQEKNIDAITIEMKNRNIPDRVAMVFKNTALQVLLEGNSKETAMKKAAEQVRELFPQYFK